MIIVQLSLQQLIWDVWRVAQHVWGSVVVFAVWLTVYWPQLCLFVSVTGLFVS